MFLAVLSRHDTIMLCVNKAVVTEQQAQYKLQTIKKQAFSYGAVAVSARRLLHAHRERL